MARAVFQNQGQVGGRQTRPLYTGDKERYVREMFAGIAPRYDLLNAILSFNQHKAWRRLAVRMACLQPGDRCLDVCTGTGDFALDLARAVGPTGRVVGADFCEPMIRHGLGKIARARGGPIAMMVANAESLPYPSNAFDAATVGFGIRNVAHIERAIGEMARVVKPGGRVVILEFNRPPDRWYRPFVDFYLFHILPRIGGLLSRREAYTYLPESMQQFVSREELAAAMERAGLGEIQVRDLNFGTVCIHLGRKPLPPEAKTRA
ncbi:MAG TPA: bifunctional demethylmenaquinone methyltransferase/2-methoxy-6-polyprenyl-1,4-benzoquinol methylase UbiE [Chthonomonadaceae bacterium]|nr:bifunctional demethylmenaquinone methyltransferase/2-methoxy-6-polyprenyl-1,4-benzoquinol methylase UbiE [Chthonomonadaceae bacterium]